MRRLALAFALLTACGDDGGPISIEELQPAIVSAYCSIYVTCGLIDDHATCRELFTDADVDRSLIAAVDAGKVIYHPDKARECLDGFGGSCERNTVVDNESSACDEVFEGTVAAGGQCAMDEECISQECDVPACPEACCQGACVGDAPEPRPRVGESCATNTQCIDSYCDFASSTTCMPYIPVGQACAQTYQCAAGVCANQVCTELPGPGEACNPQVPGGQCGHIGNVCNPTTMTCVAVGLSGDPCTTGGECSEIYNCNAGTCQLGPRLGEPCAGECLGRSYCDETTLLCTAPKADGQTCISDNECQSDDCDTTTNTCVTQPICI
jgi:hypothetical protein